MSKSSVRLAFDTSVACTRPPVRRQSRKRVDGPEAELARLGPGPQARVRCRGCGRSSGPRSRRRCGRPVQGADALLVAGRRGAPRTRAAVMRLCQTIAGATGRPVARSQTIVVSRWFVMPIAAIRPTPPGVACDRLRARPRAGSARCPRGRASTWPGEGNPWGNSCWAIATTSRRGRTTMARDEVVPWSSARTRSRALIAPRPAPPIAALRLRRWLPGRWPAGHVVLARCRQPRIGLDLGALARRVPAELRAEQRRDPWRDRGTAVGQGHREAHPAREHVVEAERQLLARRPGDLGLEMRHVVAERSQQVRPTAQRHDRPGRASRVGRRGARRRSRGRFVDANSSAARRSSAGRGAAPTSGRSRGDAACGAGRLRRAPRRPRRAP